MKIMANRMDRGFYKYQKEFEQKALEVLRSGWYVLGQEVAGFEEEFAAYTGAKDWMPFGLRFAYWVSEKVMKLLYREIPILPV